MKGFFMRTIIQKWLPVSFILFLLMAGFNNCSTGFDTNMSSNESASLSGATVGGGTGGGLCEESLLGLYGRGYYKFVREKCISCHATDSDKPQFASPDINWAYKVFMDKGYTRVSDNAINIGHQAGFTGPQNIQPINELRLEWQQGLKEYNQCQGVATGSNTAIDPATLLSLETSRLQLPVLALDKQERISWDLTTQLTKITPEAVIPTIPGAKLSILITRQQTAGGEDYYTLTKPMIFGSSVDIKIKTMYVYINGRPLKYPTTFKFLSAAIRAGSKEDVTGLLSTGGLTAPGTISSQDYISLAFEKLEDTKLPAPKPPILANLTGPLVRFVNSASGTLDFEVALSDIPDEPVTLTVSEEGSAMCGAGADDFVIPSANPGTNCLPEVFQAMGSQGMATPEHLKLGRARSVVGNEYNRYDWDYRYSVNSMTLAGVDTKRAFSIEFSNDIRREENRVLRLKLNIASSSALPGTQDLIYVVIRRQDNPVPAPGEVTFTQLMSSKGVLQRNCVGCHNSRDRNGQYDMTDYNLMLARKVLIPGSNRSEMYVRMNEMDRVASGKASMPIIGSLPYEYIEPVSEWILNGAKNN
jgi:hypothetical protein